MYHAVNFRGLACLLATAVTYEEMETPRLNKPPRGPHVREAEFARGAYLHQRAMAGGHLSQRHFALKMVKVSLTIWNRWIDGFGRMRSDSIEKVAKFAPPGLPRPLAAITEGEGLDPNTARAYAPQNGKLTRGYMVKTNDAAMVAAWIDRIDDDQERAKAAAECIGRLSANPRGVVAEKRPDRPHRKPD